MNLLPPLGLKARCPTSTHQMGSQQDFQGEGSDRFKLSHTRHRVTCGYVRDWVSTLLQGTLLQERKKTWGSKFIVSCCTGSGPYKQWEKQPLRADDGEAASVSGDCDEDSERAASFGRMVSRRCSHIIIWANCSFIALVILGGIILVRSL